MPNLNASENIDYDDQFALKKVDGYKDRFFKEYILSWRGSTFRSIMSGEHLLGSDGESFCYWQERMDDMTDEEIARSIGNGLYSLHLYTERGESIYQFIKRFKRLPTEGELDGIIEYMDTMEALE